ncbi:hypothetical protein [Prosthecobacter sp.]|uniref:hypothetical protein n=1 Tax=Prosthecobacter sp. TaxID=1965333 RepID=UPI002AB926D1|nr:hypothetical protein [Prosthecobacter sp.]MDZ4401075.1 hypothetical protein [Prosthecobacter sp.]
MNTLHTPSARQSTSAKPAHIPYSVSMGGLRGARAGAQMGLQEVQAFFPGLGIIGNAFGLMLALALMPERVQVPGALRASAIVMILGLAVAPLAAAWVNLRFLLRTENIIGLAPVYWLMLDMVTGNYAMEYVNQEGAQTAFIIISLCTCAYWWGTMSRPWYLPGSFLRICQFRISSDALMPIILLCFGLAMLRFAIPCKFDVALMFHSITSARWNAPWTRGSLGGWDAFTDHLSYFGYLLPTLAVVMARRKSWFHGTTITALLCAAIFLLFLSQTGSRRIIGVCLGAALLYWIMDQKKINPVKLLVAGGSLAALVWIMQMMVLTRGVGMGQVGLETAGRAAAYSLQGYKVGGTGMAGIHVDDNILRLAQAVQIIPDKLDYVYHQLIAYTLVRPIPRVLWANKPEDPGFSLQKLMNAQASLTFTIVGEFWISWGYLAVILGGWLYGRLATLSSPLFWAAPETMAPMFYGYITMTLFVGYRSMVEVLLFSYAMMGWWLVTWVLSKFRR